MEVEWKVSAVPENHDGGEVCRYSSAQNEPGCHFINIFCEPGYRYGGEGEQDNTAPGQEPLRIRSHSLWG